MNSGDYSVVSYLDEKTGDYLLYDKVYAIEVFDNVVDIQYLDNDGNKHMKDFHPQEALNSTKVIYLGKETILNGDFDKLDIHVNNNTCGLISHDELITEMFSIG